MVTRLKAYSIPSFKTGLNTAVPAHLGEKSSARTAKNVKFSLLRVEKTHGYEKFDSAALTGVPQIIDNYYQDDGDVFLMVVTHLRCYKYNTATTDFDDITGGALTGTNDQPADSDVAFNRFYFTNYNDFPQFWNGTGNIAVVPALDATTGSDIEGSIDSCKAKCIKGFANFLVLGNTLENSTERPSRVRWSRYGDPTLWENTAAGAGQAGFSDVGDVDQIVALRRLKDYLVIYKERSIWVMQYIGPPEIFVFRRIIDGVGLVSPRGVAELTNEHIFFAADGIYAFDGVSIRPLSDRININFFTSLNQNKLQVMTSLFVEEDFEILFPFVNTDESWPTQALVYNYVTGAFGFRDLPATAVGYWTQASNATWESLGSLQWDQISDYWDRKNLASEGPLNLFGDSSGYIYKMNNVDTADGADYEGYFTTKVLDLGNPNIIKRVQRIQVEVTREGDWDLQIYAAALETPYDTISFQNPKILSLDSSNAYIDLDISGRYFVFKFRTANKNEHFEISGITIQYIERSVR